MIPEEIGSGFSTRASKEGESPQALLDILREENRQLREALSQSRAAQFKLEGVLYSAPDAMVIVDRQGRIVLINALTEKMFGYSRDELLDKSLDVLIPRRFHKQHRAHLASYASAPNVRPMGAGTELWACRRDGSEFPVEVSLSPAEAEDGLLIFSAIRDISRRKQREEALRQSEVRFRNIFETSPAGMQLYQLESSGKLTLVDANPTADEILGLAHSKYIGLAIQEAFPEISKTVIPEHLCRVAVDGETWEIEEFSYESEEISGVFEVHAFQTVPGMVVVSFTDITTRIQTAETLKRLLEVSRSMLSSLNMDEVMDQVIWSLQKVLPNEISSIYLLDQAAKCLRPTRVVGTGYIADSLVKRSIPLGQGIFGAVAKSGQSEMVNDAHLDPRSIYPEGAQVVREHIISIPMQIQGETIGLFNVGRLKGAPFTEKEFELAKLFTYQAATAIHNAKLYMEADRQSSRLRILSRNLADAQEAERMTLARELHDRVGQNLTAIDFNLSMINSLLPIDSPAGDQIEFRVNSSLELLANTAIRIRQVMADLRPPVIDDYGLLAALDWYGKQIREQWDIKIAVRGEPDLTLTPEEELAMFRITQEAITNTLKHAEATAVTIDLEMVPERNTTRLTIADDGRGFQMPTQRGLDERQSWGLIGMIERAEAVGAVCSIRSAPGEGTQVIVEVSR